jgi:UDP-GlcNAc:undecaprenyl-phosphate GlcNAc-1-phosphate transferase
MLGSVSITGPVKSATVIAVIVPVLVLGLPIFDTCFAIMRRIASGRPIMEADRGHLHHRLMAAGMGQKRSVLTLYGVSGVMGVTAVIFSRDLFIEAGALLLIAITFIYIFLTDATGTYMKPRGVNAARREKREERLGGGRIAGAETYAAGGNSLGAETQADDGNTAGAETQADDGNTARVETCAGGGKTQ